MDVVMGRKHRLLGRNSWFSSHVWWRQPHHSQARGRHCAAGLLRGSQVQERWQPSWGETQKARIIWIPRMVSFFHGKLLMWFPTMENKPAMTGNATASHLWWSLGDGAIPRVLIHFLRDFSINRPAIGDHSAKPPSVVCNSLKKSVLARHLWSAFTTWSRPLAFVAAQLQMTHEIGGKHAPFAADEWSVYSLWQILRSRMDGVYLRHVLLIRLVSTRDPTNPLTNFQYLSKGTQTTTNRNVTHRGRSL